MSREEKKDFLFEAQAKECAKVLFGAFEAVFQKKQALDHFLTGVFRNNPKYGSKDRKRIGNALFRVFRDYGFIATLLSEEERIAENCLLVSSVLAGEKVFPQCWINAAVFSEKELFAAACKEEILSRLQALAKEKKLFSITDNLPQWCMKYFPEGREREFAFSLLKRSPVWFRLNFPHEEKKCALIHKEFASKGLELVFHGVKKDAFSVKEDKRVLLQDFSTFRAGLFEVQDLSSQCIGNEGNIQEDFAKILDYCAGGGGKSLQMASFLNSKKSSGKVYAWDIRKNKLSEALRRGKKAGFKNIVLLDSCPDKGLFDKVVVDAPCSGSGRWRRAPEQRFLLTEEELISLADIQLEILEKAAERVKENGVLVYGTCSVFAIENTENIQRFLSKHPEFALEEFVSPLTGEKCPGFLEIFPSDGDCDGAFTARMRRR